MLEDNRHIFIDYLRAGSIIGVVMLHVAAPYLYLYGKVDQSIWQIANAFDSLVRWCVPIFLMISGALLLSKTKELTIKETLLKTLKRLVIPLLIWSTIYYFYKVNKGIFELGLYDYVQRVLGDNIQYHFWYIYALIPIYLIAPLLSKWMKTLNDKQLIYLMILGFFGISGLATYNQLFTEMKIVNYFPIKEYIYLFILGYILFKVEFTKQIRYIIYLLGILGAVLTIVLTSYFTELNESFYGFFYNYHSPTVVLMSISLFIFAKQVFKKTYSLVQIIGTTSFGVYFIHLLILDITKPYFLSNGILHVNPIIAIPFNTIIVLLFSVIFISLLHKIPKIKSYIG